MTIDGAADAAEREAMVLRLGAEGRGRAEIAVALGLSPEALAAGAAADAGLDAALRAAASLAMAWWEALARDSCAAGRRFNFAGWGREMQRRFGAAWAGDGAVAPAAAPEPEPGPVWRPDGYRRTPRPGERAVYLIPCNGRVKRRVNGLCDCGSCRDERRWAAEEAAYYAKYPEQRPARLLAQTKAKSKKTA